jgi:hypothetical protein
VTSTLAKIVGLLFAINTGYPAPICRYRIFNVLSATTAQSTHKM